MEKKTFSCDTEGLAGAQAFLETVCVEPKPSILLDEVVSNIVRCSGATGFDVELDRGGDGLKMTFSDDGKAFNPLEVPPPDVNASIEDRQVGGLGMHLVRKMSKSVNYRREDGRNVLTIVL